MAIQSKLVIGTDENKQKTFNVIDCKFVLDRPYDCISPTGNVHMETLEVTLYPEAAENFFHKWYTYKNTEEVTLKIILPDYKVETYHDIYLEDAVCYTLTESFEKISEKNEDFEKNRRRTLKIGIQAKRASLRKKGVSKQKARAVAKSKNEFAPKKNEELEEIKKREEKWEGNLNDYERLKLAENSLEIERTTGQTMGNQMTLEEADKQSANPYYVSPEDKNFKEIEHRMFSINCATCVTTYALRRRGFNLAANGNVGNSGAHEAKPEDRIARADNLWLMKGTNVYTKWKNADGSEAKPTLVRDFMAEKEVYKMTPELYKEFYEENTKEEGIYITTVIWRETNGSKGCGHVTIVERWKDEKGKLHLSRIEPQVYDEDKGTKRSMDDFYQYLYSDPTNCIGLMRVDNKLYDTTHHNNIFKYE